MKFKRWMAMATAAVLAFGTLAGCGQSGKKTESTAASTESSAEASGKKLKIVATIFDHAARRGDIDGLRRCARCLLTLRRLLPRREHLIDTLSLASAGTALCPVRATAGTEQKHKRQCHRPYILLISHAVFLRCTAAIREQSPNAIASAATMVEPTGVPARIDARIPSSAQVTESSAEQTVTLLKL